MFCVCPADGHAQSFPLPHQDHPFFRPGDGGVEQGPVEHDGVGVLDADDHRVVLGALAFVDGGTGSGKRYKKKSFGWYQNVIRTNGEEL